MSIVILVPTYRCESTIIDTLESIQAQGDALQAVSEVIIAEDGSRDKVAEVARRIWKSSVPLRIMEREFNCGEYASVNNAVAAFSPETEWFLIMHGDNKAKPGWLKAFVDRIRVTGPEVGLVGSSYDTWFDDAHVLPGENEPGKVVTVPGSKESIASTLRMGCWWHISSSAIRVKAYRDVGGLPKIMQLKGDWDFMLRILAAGWTIEHMPMSYMMYRENPQGSSSITFKRHMDITETMAVIGRFHAALKAGGLFALHLQYSWHLMRRMGKALFKGDVTRILWAMPAFGIVNASLWSCLTDPKRSAQLVDVRK